MRNFESGVDRSANEGRESTTEITPPPFEGTMIKLENAPNKTVSWVENGNTMTARYAEREGKKGFLWSNESKGGYKWIEEISDGIYQHTTHDSDGTDMDPAILANNVAAGMLETLNKLA